MDVNGTRFHHVREREDWARMEEAGEAAWVNVEWSGTHEAVRLFRETFRFGTPPTPSSDDSALDPAGRRGAAADRYGTIYWIAEDAAAVWRLQPDGEAELYWDVARDARELARTGAVAPPPADASGFRPEAAPAAAPVALRGLTVTDHHYLVVGNPPGRELLVLDLHAGGPALRLRWPEGQPFAPWDLDPAPRGGTWVLDRDALEDSGRLWLLDRTFRVVDLAGWPSPAPLDEPPEPMAVEAGPPAHFAPESGGGAVPHPPRALPGPLPLDDLPAPEALAELPGGKLALAAPISVCGLGDGSVAFLDSPPGGDFSRVVRVDAGRVAGVIPLEDAIPVSGEEDRMASLHAYDAAWVPGTDPGGAAGALLLAESGGNQAFEILVDWDATGPTADAACRGPVLHLAERSVCLPAPSDYLPLRRYGGAELVVRGGRVLYDFRDRWIEIRPISRPLYARAATLDGPVLDGGVEGCVWHRVALDACIPPGTRVVVEARAADVDEEVELADWVEHALYLRGDGSEIAWHGRFGPEGREGEGTWETLLQDVEGRYAQLRLRLQGTGRATPLVRGMRVHYPRFSYLHRYLPDIYRDERAAASFADRFLANFEGLLTTWEGRIVEARRLFDPSATPAEALEWLAGWLGVVLDPLWTEAKRRLFLRHAAELYRWRGTPRGIEVAVRLYLEENPGDELFDPGARRHEEWQRAFEREERQRGGRRAGQRAERSKVRVVERFRTRRWLRRTGDAGAQADVLAPLTASLLRDNAHRFVLLVPADLDEDTLAVVRRIAELEKPAHTTFDLDFFWSLFRVGSARVGLDTELGEGARYRPAILGDDPVLGVVHLTGAHPFNVGRRIVPGRDPYGGLPPL